jgi:hypothetical protein
MKQAEYQVNVVRHDHGDAHEQLLLMIVQRMTKSDRSCAGWQYPPIACREGDEE